MSAVREEVIASFRTQAVWCRRLGSPFTAGLLECGAAELSDGGGLSGLLGSWPGDPVADALPLRLAGALHALVLGGVDPALAEVYPPRTPDPEAVWAVATVSIAAHEPFIREFLRSPPQTNEVRRSGVLLGGFLEVARRASLPLRLLEIGASGGLNLIWDRYRYRLGARGWGDPAGAVEIAPEWQGGWPPLDVPARVVERTACDTNPLDLDRADHRLRLRSYVWADQRERLALLDGAMAAARRAGVRVDRADAADWLSARLAEPASGRASVVYHSVVWQYLPAAVRDRVAEVVRAAGERAGDGAPVAWLRFEPEPGGAFELRLTYWPGGCDLVLAHAQAHGASVNWLG